MSCPGEPPGSLFDTGFFVSRAEPPLCITGFSAAPNGRSNSPFFIMQVRKQVASHVRGVVLRLVRAVSHSPFSVIFTPSYCRGRDQLDTGFPYQADLPSRVPIVPDCWHHVLFLISSCAYSLLKYIPLGFPKGPLPPQSPTPPPPLSLQAPSFRGNPVIPLRNAVSPSL